MRTIERTGKFRRDYRREAKTYGMEQLNEALIFVLRALCLDQPLAVKYQDHPLTGDWDKHRDCHIKPDLILIYQKPDQETLRLVRLGSHSELSL
ncbi:type II toxin-antitoxin system YafQ family toxin [Deltaproteobacteria bacterium OttesenSCG-928-M10]|nr:type II toxin-antitoxin system YafQ family toxin [Deltaproteobacteria bacterium OttesenSCG-928-M10]